MAPSNNQRSKESFTRPVSLTPKRDYVASLVPAEQLIPPNDEQSERALLGRILTQPACFFDIRAMLDEGQVFFGVFTRVVYLAVVHVFDAGQQIRPLTVMQRLIAIGEQKTLEKVVLNDIMRESANCDATDTALHLRQLYIKRLAYEESYGIINDVFSHQSFEQIISRTRNLAELVSGKASISASRSMAKVTDSALDRIRAAASATSGLSGVNTGSGKLNKITGGWQTSDVIIGGARPGVGKTSMMLHCAKASAVSGVPTSIFSLEIDAEQCTNRLIASECGIEYSSLLKGRHRDRPFDDNDWKLIEQATQIVRELPIYFYEGGSTDINDIMYANFDFQQKFGIGFTVIDYLQKAQDRTVRGDMYQRVSSISDKIKDMNFRMKTPVMAGSQLSRNIEKQDRKNKRPQLDDLRESGKIEEDASIVFGWFRDDYYKMKRAKNDAAEGRPFEMPILDYSFEWELLKNRNGDLGTAILWADVATSRVFDEKPQEFTPVLLPAPAKDQTRTWMNNFPSTNFFDPDEGQETPF